MRVSNKQQRTSKESPALTLSARAQRQTGSAAMKAGAVHGDRGGGTSEEADEKPTSTIPCGMEGPAPRRATSSRFTKLPLLGMDFVFG